MIGKRRGFAWLQNAVCLLSTYFKQIISGIFFTVHELGSISTTQKVDPLTIILSLDLTSVSHLNGLLQIVELYWEVLTFKRAHGVHYTLVIPFFAS
jgi:hypothetical protein